MQFDQMIRSLELGEIIAVVPRRERLPRIDASGFCLTCRHPTPDEDQVATAIAYLSRLRPTKRSKTSSYVLKHVAEAWNEREPYVSNGALIEAAIRLGLRVERTGRNALIGVSCRDVRALKLNSRNVRRRAMIQKSAAEVASLFADRHHREVKYVREWGCWMYWNGQHWQRDTDGHVMRLIEQLVEDETR